MKEKHKTKHQTNGDKQRKRGDRLNLLWYHQVRIIPPQRTTSNKPILTQKKGIFASVICLRISQLYLFSLLCSRFFLSLLAPFACSSCLLRACSPCFCFPRLFSSPAILACSPGSLCLLAFLQFKCRFKCWHKCWFKC